jgi:hypothetical protein
MIAKVGLILAGISLLVSLAAAGFTGLQWWEARQQRVMANDATISFEIDTDPSDFKLGIGVRNVGPGVARIRSVKYFVDGEPVASIDDAIEAAKLDSQRLHEIELADDAMGQGEVVWVVRYNAHKADSDRAADFFENHLNAIVDYCTASGRCAVECSEKGGCKAMQK